jgi:hypothetical protein
MTYAVQYNNNIAQSIADAEAGLYDGERLPMTDAIHRWLDDCLDMEVATTQSVNGGRWINKVTVLRTVGGPDTRVTFRMAGSGETVEVRTVFGTQRAVCTVYAPQLAEVLCEAAGYLLEADAIDGGA